MSAGQAPTDLVQQMLAFLRSHTTATLATVSDENSPHASTVFFYTEDDLKFYFLTKKDTPKFKNIRQSSKVSLVVSDENLLQTVQVQGTAREVDYAKEYAPTMQKFTTMLSSHKLQWGEIPINHMLGVGYYVFVQITPIWIRWSDYKNWEHIVRFEKNF